MATRSRKSYISVQMYGFDELLKDIEAAGGSINGAVDSCMKQSAQIQQKELKAQMQKAVEKTKKTYHNGKTPYKSTMPQLIKRMPPPEIKWEGNTCIARVGYHKGKYDPNNLSDGYKTVFANYGTPRISPREFIKKAQNQAKPQIKKAQEETLKMILGRLSK